MKNNKKEFILCRYKDENIKGIEINVSILGKKLSEKNFEGLNLYIHKKHNFRGEEVKGKEAEWIITNKDTGLWLVNEKTRTKAIKAMLNLINEYGIEKLKEMLEERTNES